jgi:hypothetical protein
VIGVLPEEDVDVDVDLDKPLVCMKKACSQEAEWRFRAVCGECSRVLSNPLCDEHKKEAAWIERTQGWTLECHLATAKVKFIRL